MRFIECNYDAWDEAVVESRKQKYRSPYVVKTVIKGYDRKRSTKIYKVR